MTAAEWWQDEEVLERIRLQNDLVAVEARNHRSCSIKFLKKDAKTGSSVGQPEDVSLAFNYICKYIEENGDQCQFTLSGILEDFEGFVPTHGALFKKLKTKSTDQENTCVLSTLGFSCSYFEVQLFQASVLQDPPQVVLQDSSSQWVRDNADVNVDMIDGSNTWHAMGGFQCTTPHSSAWSEARIARLKKVPKAKETAAIVSENQAGWPTQFVSMM
ncbi:hypothetical protein JTB14_015719 [Gonioctena quinquepunctata]|nr:hypothetical protein JTB14_015719 [Gonioctena quinquepunctata]